MHMLRTLPDNVVVIPTSLNRLDSICRAILNSSSSSEYCRVNSSTLKVRHFLITVLKAN